MASVSREPIGNLHDRLTVKVEKEDYYPRFEKDLKAVSRNANVPGFRKGMVPTGMIRKMYGKQMYADAVLKAAEDELKNYLVNEKIDIFGQPIFTGEQQDFPGLDFQDPKEYEFHFEVGLRPQVTIDIPENTKVTKYKVQVTPEDIDLRINSYQMQYGEQKDAEAVEGPETVLDATIEEVDGEGNNVEEGFSGKLPAYVNLFTKEFQQQLAGKKVGDAISGPIHEMFDPERRNAVYERLELDPEHAADPSVIAKLTIDSVRSVEKAPLDKELFEKVFPGKEINSEEEFRQAVRESEEKEWSPAENNLFEHQLHHILMDLPVSLPEDFLKKMLNDPENPSSPEEIESRYPSFAKQLKWSMITSQIVEDQQLRVTSEEIRSNLFGQLKQYLGGSEVSEEEEWVARYLENIMKDKKQVENTADMLMTRKVFDWLASQVTVEEKEISEEDFKKIVESHQHHH